MQKSDAIAAVALALGLLFAALCAWVGGGIGGAFLEARRHGGTGMAAIPPEECRAGDVLFFVPTLRGIRFDSGMQMIMTGKPAVHVAMVVADLDPCVRGGGAGGVLRAWELEIGPGGTAELHLTNLRARIAAAEQRDSMVVIRHRDATTATAGGDPLSLWRAVRRLQAWARAGPPLKYRASFYLESYDTAHAAPGVLAIHPPMPALPAPFHRRTLAELLEVRSLICTDLLLLTTALAAAGTEGGKGAEGDDGGGEPASQWPAELWEKSSGSGESNVSRRRVVSSTLFPLY